MALHTEKNIWTYDLLCYLSKCIIKTPHHLFIAKTKYYIPAIVKVHLLFGEKILEASRRGNQNMHALLEHI
jgi:hypothetical protein